MLVHPKDLIPMEEQKGVVNCVPCDGCPKKYIGQTGRSLKYRLAEHWRALKKGDVATSALAEHALETGHPVNLSKAEVIDYHPFTTNRCLLENWHIQHTMDALSRERNSSYSVHCTVRLIVMQQTYIVLTNIMVSVIITNLIP